MTQVAYPLSRDANGVPITTIGLQTAAKTVAFTGAAGNGAVGTVAVFTVTGVVYMNAPALCTEDLVSAGGGTIELGTATLTAGITSQQTATTIDNHGVWTESTITAAGFVDAHGFHLVNENVILTVGTANVTDGTLVFYCNWVPLSSDGNVVPA